MNPIQEAQPNPIQEAQPMCLKDFQVFIFLFRPTCQL